MVTRPDKPLWKRAAIGLFSALLMSCQHMAADPQPDRVLGETSVAFLKLINSANAHGVIKTGAPPGLDAQREAELIRVCGAGASGKRLQEVAQGYTTESYGPPVGRDTGKGLLKEFSAVYGNPLTEHDFYAKVSQDSAPISAWTCFRFGRAACMNAEHRHGATACTFESRDVLMDLIGQFRIENGVALKVRPLRLFYAKSMAKADEKMGISISLSAQSVWREANRSYDQAVFSHTLLREQLMISNRHTVEAIRGAAASHPQSKYYPTDDLEWAKYSRLPLIPWSIKNAAGAPVHDEAAGGVSLSIKVAEVGRVPETLKLAELLEKDAGKLLLDAIQEVSK